MSLDVVFAVMMMFFLLVYGFVLPLNVVSVASKPCSTLVKYGVYSEAKGDIQGR